MNQILKTIAGVAIILAIISTGCSNEHKSKKVKELETLEAEKVEHKADVGEKGEGEEDGTQFSKTDVYDVVKKGVHLVLAYDAENNVFKGTVANMTEEVIESVRVEVHLSNGVELGPTTPFNMQPGTMADVMLKGSEKDFETWSTHTEVGGSEHGGEKDGEGEHGGEKEGEHK